jgi:N-acetylglucosaminyl-diphospho-decaprenol L-rhamnosyltransferase
MTSKPLVTALVLNYRSHRDTVRCVCALKAQTIGQHIEIVVIDNHSCDESIGFIRAQLGTLDRVRIIEERANVGFARGNNDALRFASGEYLLIVNPDNLLPPTALEAMLQTLQSHPNAGIVGPALIHPDGSVRPSARSLPSLFELLRKRLMPARWQREYDAWLQRIAGSETIEVDWLVGGCLLLRRDLFERLGGFDERFFLFFEDMDLCRRIRQMGKSVLYLPRIRVQDRRSRLSGSTLLSLLRRRTTWIHAWSGVKYFWKWRVDGR